MKNISTSGQVICLGVLFSAAVKPQQPRIYRHDHCAYRHQGGSQRSGYEHREVSDLERILEEARGARTRPIVTDGVCSMDGDVAPLAEICALAERHDARVMGG